MLARALALDNPAGVSPEGLSGASYRPGQPGQGGFTGSFALKKGSAATCRMNLCTFAMRSVKPDSVIDVNL